MEAPPPVDFPEPPLRTRREIFILLVGVTVGLLVATLLVPIVFGDAIDESTTGQSTVTPFSAPPIDDDADPSTGSSVTQPTTAAGSGVASAGAVTAGGPASTVPLAQRTASDVGVTPEAIRIGIPIPDTGPVLAAGFKALTVEQTKQLWTVMLEEQNKRGGVLGRKLEAKFAVWDVTNPIPATRENCLYFAQEAKVFAVIDTISYQPWIGCITKEQHIPFLSFAGSYDDFYATGLVHTLDQGVTRGFRNQVLGLEQMGLLKGRVIGVIMDDCPGDEAAAAAGTFPTLAKLGYEAKHRAVFSCSDNAQRAAQMSVQVNQFKAANVDTILIAAQSFFGPLFSREADAQQYRPKYSVTDLGNNTADGLSLYPTSAEGLIALSGLRRHEERARRPEPAIDAACRDAYNRGSGQSVARGGDTSDQVIMTCAVVRVFTAAAERAGVQITRGRFGGAFGVLGRFETPFMMPANFGGNRLDGLEAIHTLVWRADCSCFSPVDDYRPAPS
jgi:ABC-type branched-subunit amino acid transport system substrate-binding protein